MSLTSYRLRRGHIEIRQPNTYCQFKMYFDGYLFQVEKLLRTNESYHIDRSWSYKSFREAKQQFLYLYENYKP